MMVLIAHISKISSTGNYILLIFYMPRMQHYINTIIISQQVTALQLKHTQQKCQKTLVAYKLHRAICVTHPSLGAIDIQVD